MAQWTLLCKVSSNAKFAYIVGMGWAALTLVVLRSFPISSTVNDNLENNKCDSVCHQGVFQASLFLVF